MKPSNEFEKKKTSFKHFDSSRDKRQFKDKICLYGMDSIYTSSCSLFKYCLCICVNYADLNLLQALNLKRTNLDF